MRKRSPALCTLLAVLLLPTLSVPASAQSYQGGMRGSVKDAQGVIPGVTVTLVNESNGVSRDTVTNPVGEYSFPALDPATYAVKATVQGYKTFERKGIRIGTQSFVTLDVVLEIGAIEETITVTADSPLVETSNASTGDVLDQRTLQELPSVGRNAFLLSVTVPTVVSSGDTHWNRMQDQTGASALSVGGGAVRGNNYLLDGFPITDIQNRSSANPSIEVIEDMKVQVHTYDAEMGRTGGGVFNTTAKSGTNSFRGSGFGTIRPNAVTGSNFFLKIQNIPNADQFWHQGGGGFGGPIAKNKTFFWFATEAYRDGLTQNGNLHFPTAAERTGDFSGLTDSTGRPIIIYDPMTGDANGNNRQPFPNNRIPANRINPVGAKIVSYLPLPNNGGAGDNGSVNYAAQDTIKDAAQQASVKVDHHFNDRIALSGVFLAQNSHEPQNNYFPDARYAAPSYQLDRGIKVFVLNNTYIMSPTTVLTLRYGRNIFNDNNNLPFDFDTHTLGFNKPFTDAIQVQKFPSFSFTGYNGTGFTGKATRRYYSDGVNGTFTKLAGEHSFKTGADYRVLGIKALSYGASAGTYTFNGQFTGSAANNSSAMSKNAIADLLLGFPSSGNITVPTEFDDYIKYSSAYVQDDWRVNPRLTLNYGLRLEHETGFAERDNKLIVGLDQTAVSPLNVTIPAGIDPLHPTQARQVKGGLVYAGSNGTSNHWGNPPKIKPSPRLGIVFSATEKTVLRGGYGMYWAPWNYGVSQPTGYSATTTLSQFTTVPITSIDNPFPTGLLPISGNALGLASGASSSVSFVDPAMTAPRVQQWSLDLQRELPGNTSITFGYVGNRGDHLDYSTSINLNQLPAEYLSLGSALTQNVPNPFFGNSQAGTLASLATVQRLSLLLPFPQYGANAVNMTTNGARSMYHAAVIQVRKRASWWGGNFSYTYSRLNDNQVGSSNYYSSAPGVQDNYSYIPESMRVVASATPFNPDVDYGISLLDQPHKIVMSPTLQLPVGKGRAHLNKGGWSDYLIGGWSFAAVINLQSGFPMGVSQTPNTLNLNGGTQRPNVVAGQEFLVPGDITDRLIANPADNKYFNPAAFSQSPSFTFGNAPRLLPGVRSPWRNTVDLSINKEFRTGGSTRATLRMEIINLTNTPWFAALSSSQFGSGSFGQVITQGNYSRLAQLTLKLAF
jgi:hypothetical protein